MPSPKFSVLVALALLSLVCAQYGEMLVPRYYQGLNVLGARDSGDCAANSHSCLDVNATTCCSNDQYCIIQTDNTPACCAIGSNCGITCGSTAYICQSTATVSGTQSVVQACCPRSCPSTSQYKCASAYGGGCCSFNFGCTSSNQCISSAAASTSNAIVSIVPSGCTTNQYACATSLGGGCCDNGLACTVSNSINYCAATVGTAVVTRTGAGGIITEVPSSSGGGGLSTGAKAGIGTGIAGGLLIAIGLMIWFIVIHRRNSKTSQAMSAPAVSQNGGGSSKPGGQKRPSQGRQPSDYFGPSAAAGPFTEDHISTATTPNTNRGGVPAVPETPGDIASPVEIDSRNHSEVPSPGNFEYLKTPVEHPIELP